MDAVRQFVKKNTQEAVVDVALKQYETELATNAAPMQAAASPQSQRAQAYADAAAGFLAAMGMETLHIDFSECESADDALTTFGRVFNGKFNAKTLGNLFRTVDADIEKKSAPPVDPSTQPLMDAFQSEYIGVAHEELSTYVDSCWAKFKEAPTLYKYPYCAIVQSSGFGKTRLLRELAVLFEDRNRHVKKEENKGDELHRLVYVNVRDVPGSTGFPPTTTALKSHFFPKDKASIGANPEVPLADKLVQLFLFVMQPDAPRASSDDKTPSTMHQLLMDLFLGKDTPLTEALKAADVKTLKAVHGMDDQSPTKGRRLMVLAVDEARALLPKSEADGIGWFRTWRRALALANKTIRGETDQAVLRKDWGIFGIVVDTNSKISNFVPTAAMDPSQRYSNRPIELFPPFVLTHTMDVLHATKLNAHTKRVADTDGTKTPLTRYKSAVTYAMKALRESPSGRSSWESLRMLGRPLWLKLDTTIQNSKEGLVQLAAGKLLGGKDPLKPDSFNDETLNGVAAVLCRVGIRPYSSSPMAAGIVADFMAVLSYVGHMHDQFVSSYSSDPILTLGATSIWHEQSMLAERMLPQLRKLLHQEVLDVGHVDVVVARIVLLLAMDACASLEGDSRAIGEFFSVWTFLTALQGDSPTLRVAKKATKAKATASTVSPFSASTSTSVPSASHESETSSSSPPADTQPRAVAQPVQAPKITSSMLIDADETATKDALKAVESQWKDWFVSFTHFVQLADIPSEACLWAMLGRRAAGIMPRGQKAVDLVIPICTPGPSGAAFTEANVRVSMIFVQVKNVERADSTFPGSATVKMRPREVFTRTTTKKNPDDSGKKTADSNSEEKIEDSEEKTAEHSEEKTNDSGAAKQSTAKTPKALSPAQQSKLEKELQKKEEKAKFAALGPESVLRIYMSLRSKKVERFYLEDIVERQTSHVLCLKGLGSLKATSEAGRVVVLRQAVVEELKKLLPPWWKVCTLVEEDIALRDKKSRIHSGDQGAGVERFGMAKKTLVQCALNPLAETVLLNSDDAETIPLTKSRLGREAPIRNDHPSSDPPTESQGIKRSREDQVDASPARSEKKAKT